MTDKPKRPRDPNQLAKQIVDLATGQCKEASTAEPTEMGRLGRVGGLKGGPARSERLSPERRKEIARAAAEARWRSDDS